MPLALTAREPCDSSQMSRSWLPALLMCAASLPVFAERLALTQYSVADGLPSDTIRTLMVDHAGFLWIGTSGGLARFDGRNVEPLDTSRVMPNDTIYSLLETDDGELWLGGTGIARLDLSNSGSQQFETVTCDGCERWTANDQPVVFSMIQTHDGEVWTGTTEGVFRFRREGSRWLGAAVDIGMVIDPTDQFRPRYVFQIAKHPDGSLWFGTSSGVYCYRDGARSGRLIVFDELKEPVIKHIAAAPDGHVWVTDATRLARLKTGSGGEPVLESRFGARDSGVHDWISGIFVTGSDELLLAKDTGLQRLTEIAAPRPRFGPPLSKASGIMSADFQAIASDSHGNLWLGSATRGLTRWNREGVVTYTEAEGLTRDRAGYMAQSLRGDLITVSDRDHRLFQVWQGSRFVDVRPRFPSDHPDTWFQNIVQDHLGEWWIATAKGACRFAATERFESLDQRAPLHCYDKRDGLTDGGVFGIYEDHNGDLWLSSWSDKQRLSLWRRRTDTIESLGSLPGFAADDICYPVMLEDRSGQLWLGSWGHGLYRFDGHRAHAIGADSGVAASSVTGGVIDQNGSLWFSVYQNGVVRIEQPESEQRRIVLIRKAEGLPSLDVANLSVDAEGRVWVATALGLSCFGKDGRLQRNYGLADGLPSARARAVLCDRQARTWVLTFDGISLLPAPEVIREPPHDPRIVSLRLGNRRIPVALAGEHELRDLVTASDQNSLELRVVSPMLGSAGRVHYRVSLEGAATTPPADRDDAQIEFPSLAAGHYRVSVRAVSEAGVESVNSALVSFRVLAPWWRRGWTLSLAAALVAVAAFASHRLSVRRAIAVERLRTRIATDLHDDIGSTLSSIALQGALLNRKLPDLAPDDRARLERIATSAGELVETMGDIVWSVNPSYDRVSDLAHRMHHFAREATDAAGMTLRFEAPQSAEALLDAPVRRQVYLIFKELVANAIKHSQSPELVVEVTQVGHGLRLVVRDRGRGFSVSETGARGNGLKSMRMRAESIGARLTMESSPGKGVRTELVV